MDENKDVTNQSATQPMQATDAKTIRFMFEQFLTQYQSLIKTLNSVPIHPSMRSNILFSLDTGHLWAREAFMSLLISAQEMEKEKEATPLENDAA